ncbi:hypothetical protein JKA73_27200 [Myxococcus xanthus]|uniref:hypothetical protein n=1 Tax=Myxococcus xanthus TaxID=34 RepID=UPI001917577F|nr:hypothetical protein [Myxococcus xanthus]QQR48516.1 hypothetical protein JKA73_27200 [Myxococcus xanthus]
MSPGVFHASHTHTPSRPHDPHGALGRRPPHWSGHAAAGRKDEAISRDKKSLELNPKNDNAVKKLRELGAAPATAKSRAALGAYSISSLSRAAWVSR